MPSDAVSGIYFAKLVREDGTAGASHIFFVVRDDDGNSDLLFQTSDTTWQAYNQYGGNSLYTGGPGTNPGRAYKVSYNRPFTTRGPTPEDSPFNAEYPMVRWLERNGYDVSYFTGVDADRRGGGDPRPQDVPLGRARRVLVGRRSAPTSRPRATPGSTSPSSAATRCFWKTRWENSIDGSGTDHRTLVSYKETHANAKIDPTSDLDGDLARPALQSNPEGGQPENALTGTIFTVNCRHLGDQGAGGRRQDALLAQHERRLARPQPDGDARRQHPRLRVGRGPRQRLAPRRARSTCPRPRVDVPQRLQDYGSTYGPGTATHNLTLYRAPSGALVFGAGTIQWSWGLDGNHDRGGSTPDPRMQQATVNLLADMGAQPDTLQGGLVSATASTDTTAPSSQIESPSAGDNVESGGTTTISGTATDSVGSETGAGQVGGVEVSVDGGATWHPAQGRANWSYTWTPGATGSATIKTRAADDSGNLETPGAGVTVNVVARTCPCSIWNDSFTAPGDGDSNAVEVGVKFRSDEGGFITGLRFYKTPGNTGTHVGHLWTANGTQLAQATFTAETSSGWQEVSFASPVAIDANTTYVASYHAPNGNYSFSNNYFANGGFDSAPLHALGNDVDGPDGIYKYGPSGGLFAGSGPDTFQSSNYWVDVVFNSDVGPDVTAPTISSRSPASGASGVATDTDVAATFSEPMNPGTIDGTTVELRDPSNALVPATVTYNAAQKRGTLHPNGALQHSATYTATIKGGSGGVKDAAGNALASDSTWSFTTAAPPPPPPDEGPGGPILVISNAANPFGRYYAEILRAEGLNEFTATDISNVTPSVLNSHDVAILGEGALSSGQAQMLNDWVQAGGNLIAMRPDPQLAGLLGLTSTAERARQRLPRRQYGLGPRGGHRRPDDPVPRHRGPLHRQRRHPDDRHALLGRDHVHSQPGRHPAKRWRKRRSGRRIHLRPGPLRRLYAPRQPGLVGGRARQCRRRKPADPLRRPVLRSKARGCPARLGEPRQGGDSAGR